MSISLAEAHRRISRAVTSIQDMLSEKRFLDNTHDMKRTTMAREVMAAIGAKDVGH